VFYKAMVEKDPSSVSPLSHHRSGNNQDMGGDREGAEREAISLGILVTGYSYQPAYLYLCRPTAAYLLAAS
jgi:hypothetical protein